MPAAPPLGPTLHLLLALVLSAAEPTAAALAPTARARMLASGRVGGEVVARLEREARVAVMVSFALAGGRRPRDLPAADRRRALDEAREAVLAGAPASEVHLRRRFASVDAFAAEVTPAGVLALLAHPATLRIDVDTGGTGALTETLPLARLAQVRALDYTGAGITVAVIDSGVDTDHPDLSDAIVAESCFCSGGGGCCPGGGATRSGRGSAEDDHGHGTNVTGIITSRGTVAPAGGAPDADIVAIKVLDSSNTFCCTSDVIAALDAVIEHHPEVEIVNLSLATTLLFPGDCDGATALTSAFASAIDTLRERGVSVFAAAGNQGSGTMMPAPACVAGAVSVGAVWDADVGPRSFTSCTDATTAPDRVACFTNSNSSTDVFAPGALVTSTGLGGGTSTLAGTSQATPVVAACAAALLSAVPTLSPDQIASLLATSPTQVTDPKNGLVFPRLDCLDALTTALASVTTSTSTTTTTSTTLPPVCTPAPDAACHRVPPGRASIRIRDAARDGQDRLRWRWSGGGTEVEEFLDPVDNGAVGYALCIYDASGRRQPLLEAGVAGRGVCPPRRCWEERAGGIRYRNRHGNAAGVTALRFKPDRRGATIELRAAGAYLDPPAPPLELPVVVQLIADDGAARRCWEAEFSTARRNRLGVLRAKGP